MKVDNVFNFLMELDKLKAVYRRSYIFDVSRNENSAEHSWHLAMAIITLRSELNLDFDLLRALKIALVHDICEIGAGDVSAYDPARHGQKVKEQDYMNELSNMPISCAEEFKFLWKEYEDQISQESRWVKIVDKIMPFMMNINTHGKAWLEQGITRSQVINNNNVVKEEAPEIYTWISHQIDLAVDKGWLINS